MNLYWLPFITLFFTIQLNCKGQSADSIEIAPISTEAFKRENQNRLRNIFLSKIRIIELKGDPNWFELSDDPDSSLYSNLDTACIVLKNGGIWNPLTVPSTKSVPLGKMIFKKKQDSSYFNTMKYAQFLSQNQAYGYPYFMIDSLFFTNSYFNSKGKLIMKVQFVNKPKSEKESNALTNRKVLFISAEKK